jgi:hypothetical protein
VLEAMDVDLCMMRLTRHGQSNMAASRCRIAIALK